MDRYEQFRVAALDRGIPEDEVTRFAAHLRFAICANSPVDGEVVGRLGGLPRLPVGTEWPGSDYPLPFIGFVDCATLPRVEGLGLPEDGSLLFFLHHESDMEDCEEPQGRVLYVPAGTETETAAPPEDHDKRTHYCENIPFVIPERQISAWVRPELPEWLEDRDDDLADAEEPKRLLEELKHLDQLCEVVEELWPDTGRRSGIRFGGHFVNVGSSDGPWDNFATDSLHDLQGRNYGSWGEEEWHRQREEAYRLEQEWVALAQFPTESEVYYGSFLISPDDLAAKRFDRAHSFTMFTE